MANIAEVGFAADTSELKTAKTALDALVPSAVKVEKAADKVGKSLDDAGKSAGDAASSVDKLPLAMDKVTKSAGDMSSAVEKAAEGTNKLTTSVGKAAIGATGGAAAIKRAAVANDNMAVSNVAVTGTANAAATATGRLAVAGEGAAVAAGAAGTGAAAAGVGFTGMALGAIGAVVALGLLVGILAAAVFGAITFAGAFLNLKKSVGETTDGLGLTEKQLDRLKKKGVDVGVTLQDAMSGFGYAVGTALKDAFEGPLKSVAEWTKKAWDDIVSFSSNALDQMVKVTIGTVAAIAAVWGDIPGVLGDLFFQGVNTVIDGYNTIVKAGWDFFYSLVDAVAGIPFAIYNAFTGGVKLAGSALDMLWEWVQGNFNTIVYLWQNWPTILGALFLEGVKKAFGAIVWLYEKSRDTIKALWEGGKNLVTGDIPNIGNTFAGKAAAAGDKAAAAYNGAGAAYDKFKKKFAGDFQKGTLTARSDRLTRAAGDPGKTPKGPKSDAAKFEDIVTGAQNDIAAQKARADATVLSATAAATLEQKTKLLNEAQTKGIALTDGMRKKIDELAAAYGQAKVAADNAIALRDILKGADGDIAALKSKAELIGLVGRQLAYQTEMQKLLNEAKAKGLTVDQIAAAKPQFEAKATAFADQSQTNAHDEFMSGVTQGAKERKIALEQERAAIGLNADEVNRLKIENDLLAQARQKNIDLTPADIAAIQGIAAEQSATEAAIRKTTEALNFAKDTAKGFFKDFLGGLREGKSLWSSFADAAVGALNKIIDKFLDKALDVAIDSLFKLASSGFAKGGTFGGSSGGTAEGFANGAGFANGIVDSPTMFAFGKGGANLGVMGEAGPEAVMPLERGPDGSLGVQMYGGNGNSGGSVFAPNITVANTYKIEGAISSTEITASIRASAEQTQETVKRNMFGWLQAFQRDGAIV